MTVSELESCLGHSKPLIGMVHLLPLPGSPRYVGGLDRIEARALEDAQVLEEAGFDALLVENYGDAPFYPIRVPAETIAAMAAVCSRIRATVRIPLGVNVLRNDARAALAVAVAVGTRFIRVNVHTGVVAADQGLLSGEAHETLRLRQSLQTDVAIFADVAVKHSWPLGEPSLADWAADTVERGLADGVIVTGSRTGSRVSTADVRDVKRAVGNVPVLAGSGVTPANVASLLEIADGAIVGTSIKARGETAAPVHLSRARSLTEAAHGS